MKLIVANLKMNMDFKTTLEYVNNVDKSIVVCPSYIYIPYFLKNSIVGAQDCFIYDTGSYTGYISPLHLKEMGVQYVIIGHSERRKVEDDLLITEDGCEVLSKDIIKEMDEIEQFMKLHQ